MADHSDNSDSGDTDSDSSIPSLFSGMLWGTDGPGRDVMRRDRWKHLKPMLRPVEIPPPSLRISWDDMHKIAAGYMPKRRSDKWLAYMSDDRLFIHRSDSGYCAYEVTFSAKGRGVRATSARIESHPRRKRPSFDPDSFDPAKETRDLLLAMMHVGGEPMPRRSADLFDQMLWGREGPPVRVATRKSWGKIAPISRPVRVEPPPLVLGRDDMQRLAVGYVPGVMEDKWTSFMEGNRLFIHRSWTGMGIFEVTFNAKGFFSSRDGFLITGVKTETAHDWMSGFGELQRPTDKYKRMYALWHFLQNLLIHLASDPVPVSAYPLSLRDANAFKKAAEG